MARLSIRLLGPFEVTLDGEPVTGFVSDKARALLAYLAIEADHPQRRESLAGLLWPDYREEDARRSLSSALANVRKLIGDREANPPFLEITHQTIQFDRASDSWIDVAAFITSLEASKESKRADPHALSQLEEAIKSYQGEFLKGFSIADSQAFDEWALFERESLSRQALEALDRLIGWYEGRGQVEQALPYARRQVDLDPLRESAHRHLMRLLWHLGERAKALEQYEVCRRILQADLGVEPDRQTTALYQQIKAGKLEPLPLAPPHPQPVGIPLQHPPRAQHFAGRGLELAQLLDELQPGCLVTLCGPGGIGKTALAAEALWTLAPADQPPSSFPDGLVFYSFYGRPAVALAFEHIARSFDPAARDTSPEAVHRLLSRKQALLVFDGTEQADDLGALLRVQGASGVLITTRLRGDAPAGRQELRPLPAGDAVDLLRAWAGERAGGETALGRICELVDGLPLAVRLAGRYLDSTSQTAAEYLAWLAETPIQALSHGAHREESVEILLARSLEEVSGLARQLLAVVGLLALAPFAPEPAARALELPSALAQRTLGELVGYGLLLRPGDRYAVSHALVHTYARRRLAPPAGAAARLAAYYSAFAREQSEQGLAGYARLDAERMHLMQVLAGCGERAEWEMVHSLVWAVDTYLDIQGHWTERVAALEQGVTAARELGRRHDEGASLSQLGLAHAELGRARRAIEHHQQALAIAREISDRRGEGQALGNLGMAYADLGETHTAVDYHEQALAIAREIGDRQGQGARLANLGTAYDRLGDSWKAVDFDEQALAIAREIGDRRREGSILGNLGIGYKNLGETRTGIDYYKQSLAVSREIGARSMEGNALNNLGIAYAILGETHTAIDYHQQALATSREIGARRIEGNALGSLGLAYARLGEMRTAMDYHQQALAVVREIGDRRAEAAIVGNLGLAHAALGETRIAIGYYDQILLIHREIGDRRGEGEDFDNLGNAYAELGEVPKAIDYYEQALAIGREISDRAIEGNALNDLGLAYTLLGETRKAIEHYGQALAIGREIGDRSMEGNTLGNLGVAYANLGEARTAIDYFERSLATAREIGDRRIEGNALDNLGLAYADLGEVRTAIGYYEQSLVIAHKIGNRHTEGTILANLGRAYEKLEEPARARELWTQALAILEAMEDPRAEQVRCQLAELQE